MAIDPQGKIVLITGANRGIGLAYAKAFLDAGVAKLYATARKPDDLKELVEANEGTVVPLALDLQDESTIAAAAAAAADVQIVVNNGGVLTQGDYASDDALKNLDFEIDVNVKGLIRMAQAFAPILKTNGGGAT